MICLIKESLCAIELSKVDKCIIAAVIIVVVIYDMVFRCSTIVQSFNYAFIHCTY